MDKIEELLCNEFIKWRREHNGEMPKTSAKLKEEKELRHEWENSKICEVYEAYMGVPLEKLPKKYEEYKGMIADLRALDQEIRSQYIDPIEFDWQRINLQKIPLESRRKTVHQCKRFEERENKTYTELINWMEANGGRIPRISIRENGQVLKAPQMTEEQKYEKNLRTKWAETMTYWVFTEYRGKSLSEIPEEFRMYADRVNRLREYEKERSVKVTEQTASKGEDKEPNPEQVVDEAEKRREFAEKLMRKSVGKRVQDNAETRQELANLVKEKEEKQMDEI